MNNYFWKVSWEEPYKIKKTSFFENFDEIKNLIKPLSGFEKKHIKQIISIKIILDDYCVIKIKKGKRG